MSKMQQEKKESKEKFKSINEKILPNTKKIFEDKEKNIKNIIELGRRRAEGIIREEIDNIDEKLKESNKNLEEASKKLQEKIKNIIDEVKTDTKREIENLIKEIQNLLENQLIEFQFKNNISETKIDTNKGLSKKMIISLFTSTISGVAVSAGLYALGDSAMVAAATTAGGVGITSSIINSSVATAIMGPWGIAIGFGVGITISVGTLLYHYFSRSERYKKGLEQFKDDIINKFKESEKNCLSDFQMYKNAFFKEIEIRLELLRKDIDMVDVKKWEDIKIRYQEKKALITEKINSLNL